MILNEKTAGAVLYEVDFTPKGKAERTSLCVYAKTRLDASNYLILNRIYGKQHSIKIHSSNLIK